MNNYLKKIEELYDELNGTYQIIYGPLHVTLEEYQDVGNGYQWLYHWQYVKDFDSLDEVIKYLERLRDEQT